MKPRFQSMAHFVEPIHKRQILDFSKEFEDDNLRFIENAKISQKGRTHCGKRRNCSL